MGISIQKIEEVQSVIFDRLYEDATNAEEHDYYLTGKDIYQYTVALKNLEDLKRNAGAE